MRINEDFYAGLMVGRIQAALIVEHMSKAGKNSHFAKKIRETATRDDLVLERMTKEGRING